MKESGLRLKKKLQSKAGETIAETDHCDRTSV